MNKKKLKIGTRASPLALIQAEIVKQKICKIHNLPNDMVEIIAMSTKGDRLTDQPLTEIGGKGLFTEEIEQALRDQQIDMAVHSCKDLPPFDPIDLSCKIFLKRENRSDAFISNKTNKFTNLPYGAIVGTSSARRRALIKHYRPDLNVVTLRGNVHTRLQKLNNQQIDATFLAYAGLIRLNIANLATEIMDDHYFPPAPAQGVIAVQTRINDKETLTLLEAIADITTTYEIMAERAFTKHLGGSCRTAIAALSTIYNNELSFMGILLSPDGNYKYSTYVTGNVNDAILIGKSAANNLRNQVGENFFETWQNN
ncbi:hydroxymethylbilane synthase [Bartonella sp. DGB1]|uniref:hydroxymethylbilane synthase n=1 Tax=Bartonella sp. DGB1 TaxID=3239807 RepID=UPI0035238841